MVPHLRRGCRPRRGRPPLRVTVSLDPEAVRPLFPALRRSHNGRQVAYLDGPGGTQVPETVIDAMADYLRQGGSNLGGGFATSDVSEQIVAAARSAVSDLMGADQEAVAFGQNMTSLTFAMSRALARTWTRGDRIVVTQLDHDANVTPWVLAAEEQGVVVDRARILIEDGTTRLRPPRIAARRANQAGSGRRRLERTGDGGRRRPGGRGGAPGGSDCLRGCGPLHATPPRRVRRLGC